MSAHKHAEIIIQWVEGYPIQYQSPTTDEWLDVPNINTLHLTGNYLNPNPLHPEYDYYQNWRIRPTTNIDWAELLNIANPDEA